ncbi:MAG: N-acetylmuramic acid 6-phosphate etherase [Butyrivibrio sp.]|nr:N-acetylmuramic acid 6-phosphate etherase [Butyrivibrio sp.]
MIELDKLATEQRNPESVNLDQMTPMEIASLMNREDGKVIAAINDVLPQVAKAIEMATAALKCGGRIIYIGAGTSGRLGVLDAAECPPTFGVDPGLVVGIIAGGKSAIIQAVEGAEDSKTLCEQDLKEAGLTPGDIVIGLAASGRTPYVVYGLKYAASVGCRTVAVACCRNSVICKEADLAIEVITGPEVITGSTRLKAGTAQKLILNMISTGSMVGIGKVYRNLMVDVQQTNEKLRARAQSITIDATGCTREEAKKALEESDGNVKTAIIMLLLNADADTARRKLQASGGVIRKVLEN